jgi:hypothetical protein
MQGRAGLGRGKGASAALARLSRADAILALAHIAGNRRGGAALQCVVLCRVCGLCPPSNGREDYSTTGPTFV